ncbi:hypothetical protein JCM19294_1001 [Nonlabens tegetincola]|uniref:HTH cro/C1-type domain-containing protein n=2 Tax=Nonlabens tegetincola TaxID=323273 RepID=A0A090Q3A5_9FLAO|nr:hypothetical protein JCM19294_1001 [Nonlabens tegetincola]
MVNGYVQNRQQPRLEVLFAIADILSVEVKDLIKETNQSNVRRTKTTPTA